MMQKAGPAPPILATTRPRRSTSLAPSLSGFRPARSLLEAMSHTLLRWSLRFMTVVARHSEHSQGTAARNLPADFSQLETPLCPGCPPRRRAAGAGPSATGSRPSSTARMMCPTTAPNFAVYLLLTDLADDGVSAPSRNCSRLSPSLTRSTRSSRLAPDRSPAAGAGAAGAPESSASPGGGALHCALSRAMPYLKSTISDSFDSLYAACSDAAVFFSPTTWASELRRLADYTAWAAHIAAMLSSRSGASSSLRAISPASIMRLRASEPASPAPAWPAAHSPSAATRPRTVRSLSAATRTSAALRASMPPRRAPLIKIYRFGKVNPG